MPHELFHSVIVFTPNAKLKTKMPHNVGYLNNMLAYIKSFKEAVFDNQKVTEINSLIQNIRSDQGRKTDKHHVQYLKERKGNLAV